MPPLRAVSIFWCWACAALLLPGCDGKGILEDLFGSHKTSLQTDDRASGARRAFDSDAADVAEPKGSSRNHQSGEKGVLSGMKAALMNNVWVKAFSATFSAHREKATQVRLSWSEVGVRLGTLSWRLPASRREGTSNPPREEKKGSDFTRNQRRTSGVKVPECPPHPMESLPEQTRRDTPLKSWIAAGIEAAPVSDYPFKNSIFWCNVFPPEVYAALDDLWIPSVFMHQDKRSGRSKKASHKNADQRFKCSLDDFLKTNDAKGLSEYKRFKQSKELWKTVQEALYSSEVEQALWAKLNITKPGWKFRDFRVQADAHGFAIGVHPDISKKLVTMMFYLPSGSDKQQQAQAGAYGTCLHTSEQYAGRSKINGAAQCAVKFPFAPNVGYSFTVNKHSFHSASAGEFGQRRTIMLNWYSSNWHN